MHTWTDDARRERERYFERVAQLLNERGDDPQEIVEALRDHVAREAEASGEPIITLDRVRPILAKLGTPEEVAGEEPRRETSCCPNVSGIGFDARSEQIRRGGLLAAKFTFRVFAIFAILDALAAIFIAAPGSLSSDGLDGSLMPTAFHFWGLLMVPVAILYNYIYTLYYEKRLSGVQDSLALAYSRHPWLTRLGFVLGGYVCVVSLYYMILFIPILPYAVIGIIFVLGLLPLSPYFTAIVGLVQIVTLRRWGKRVGVTPHWLWLGVIVGFTIYGGWVIHYQLCENAIRMAVSEDRAEREEGIQRLKALHGEQKVLQGCFGEYSGDLFVHIEGPRDPYSRQQFQTLYYRMTGLDYREITRQEAFGTRENYRGLRGLDDWENDWVTEWEIVSEEARKG